MPLMNVNALLIALRVFPHLKMIKWLGLIERVNYFMIFDYNNTSELLILTLPETKTAFQSINI